MVDPDPRVAVVAFELERKLELKRSALVRFSHDHCVLGEDPWQQPRERLPQPGRRTIWRVGEHEPEGSVRGREETQDVAAVDRSFDAGRAQVAANGLGGLWVVVNELRRSRPT